MTRPTDEGTPPLLPPPRRRRDSLPEVEQASSELDRAMVIAEVMDYVIKVSKQTPLVLPRPRVWIPLLTFFFFFFTIYSYSARPEWIWGPRVDPDAIAATHDADMRFAMFLLAQQILDYRREMGTVPTSLAQIGAKIDDVTYVRMSDTSFSLRYEARNPIILYSTESMDGFLRNALDVVTDTVLPGAGR
ncbi:MAG TPA: hypothetical protein VFT41_09465 [Gemmatimonadaceae bacterium]|nr:hypothetical protein [Gemmatimonadaceae bacterium]